MGYQYYIVDKHNRTYFELGKWGWGHINENTLNTKQYDLILSEILDKVKDGYAEGTPLSDFEEFARDITHYCENSTTVIIAWDNQLY